LIKDLKQTLETGNELIVSTNALMTNMARPFDIGDYQKALISILGESVNNFQSRVI